ncbi:hypothetical protein CALVIDRAFT_570986 [Calocera viscosa TUFC12733]|uniref:C3H1-type domain-containing protein n=1 Tax=Calocera viscosa (strain TUFC12733) TaxID=1330018 RepID=A0A167SG13_CALVF|nr:hypothetical protein CALVIDRAFT_570986 [Calocera viscosa TUFC12733]
MPTMSTDLSTSPPLTPQSALAPAISMPPSNPKYPHTRALLASLARQYRPSASFDDLGTSPVGLGPTSDGESEGEARDPISSLGGNDFVRRVVGYVRDEDEQELRKTLRESFGGDGTEFDANLDAHVLDLMHKHHNDVLGMPFSLLTPIKRPQNLSRPSSRASQHSARRPETPTLLSQSGRTASFGARNRPHTPVSASRLTSVFLQAHANSALSGEESDGGPPGLHGGPGSTFSDSPTPSPRLGSVRMPSARPMLPTSLSSSDLASAGTASPSSSPRYLNAKALEFRPGSGRPLSAMSGSFSASGPSATHGRESPGDSLWAHHSGSESGSGLLTPSFSSKLAIAAPLLPDHTKESPVPSPLAASFRAAGKGVVAVQGEDDDDDDSRPGTPASHDATPVKSNTATGTPTNTAGGTQPIRMRPRSDTLDDEEFSPFYMPTKQQAANGSGLLSVPYGCSPYDVDGSGGSSASASSPGHSYDIPGQMNMLGVTAPNPYATTSDDDMTALGGQFGRMDMLGVDGSPPSDEDMLHMPSQYLMGGLDEDGYPLQGPYAGQYAQGEDGMGMTPMEMLVQMFGTSASPQELEQALQESGYDFEGAIAWLVDRQNGAGPAGAAHNGNGAHHVHPRAHPHGAGRVLVVPREEYGRMANGGRVSPRYGMMGPGARPQGVPNRVCRYFLQGECRRADCRFSHDIERALCRFWLRGQCAKGEQCEFVHEIPAGWDQQQVQAVIAANRAGGSRSQTPPAGGVGDDFPQLGRRGSYPFGAPRGGFDPGRSRFATAVKGPSGGRGYGPQMAVSGRQFMVTPQQSRGSQEFAPQGAFDRMPQPRPSNRIRLRPPSLLPTLPTGPSVNALYMQYRNRAHQLAANRNANLTKAANAWRSHDGAAAKSFSRAAADLNARMQAELAHSARLLVKERAKIAQDAVRNRETWAADDAADRTSRGKPCGSGLGVVLGVSREGAPTSEERMECVLDLHALHANEGQEILEEFLVGLENEHYLGLAYIVVGEERHTGANDPARGTSKLRLASGVKDYLHQFAYAWQERDGVVWVDPLTHAE